MREILFRGKVLYEKCWIEGSLYIVDGLTFMIRPRMQTLQVDAESVGQYTGLTDKNGKRIFEGDIIECWSEGVRARGTVQQRKDGMWIIYPAWQKHIMWGLCPNEYGTTSVEVIGNIHDNPELSQEANHP